MEANGNTKTGKIKNKKSQKDKKIEYRLPLQFHQEPTMKSLPKTINRIVIKSESDDSDFPALPSYSPTSPDVKLNLSTSTSFSTVLARKPQVPLSTIKIQKISDVINKTSVAEKPTLPARSNSTSSGSSKILPDSRAHKSKPVTDTSNTVPVLTAATNSNQTSSKKTSTVNQAVKNEKQSRKKKSKKASKTPQGKVNTLTQEQYRAFTEQNDLKSTETAFATNIEDLCEYPELGFPLQKNATVKKEPSNKQSYAVSSENKDDASQITTSPKKLTPQEGLSSPRRLLAVSPKQEKTSPNKKFNAPIQMNLLDMVSMKVKPIKNTPTKLPTLNVKREKIKTPGKHGVLNSLDSSGPKRKRGKEREAPRKPKLSKIKKVILKERVEKKLRLALLSMAAEIKEKELTTENTGEINNNIQLLESKVQSLSLSDNEKENELSSPTLPKEVLQPEDKVLVANVELSHEELEQNKRLKCAKKLLHCRKFREYCNHFISEEIDTLTDNLLAELVRYQDRLFMKDPVKARAKRRFVCGLKEVTKNLKLRKLKLVIVAPDIEEINSEGGLNDALHCILDFCENYFTPLMFSLPRRKLGKVCRKKVPLSCVGIFNYDGAEEIHKQLMELVEEARQVYKQTLKLAQGNLTDEMVQILCNDQVDHSKVEEMRVIFWETQANQ